MATPDNTLLVRHLPCELALVEKESLLRHFQAIRVTVMGSTGKMGNSAFATFEDRETAQTALQRLHQLKVLGSVLVVEFAKSADQKNFPKLSEPPPRRSDDSREENVSTTEELSAPVVEQKKPAQDEALKIHGIEYPGNPVLHYLYPLPTVSILTNIANALASHTRFYVQVLHLMNKMNLPAPFGMVTPTPPIPSEMTKDVLTDPDNLQTEEMEVSSTEGSEIDSEEDNRPKMVQSVKRRTRENPHKIHKRRKLRIPVPQEMTAPRSSGGVFPSTSDVFEQPEQQQPKKIQLILPSNVTMDDSINEKAEIVDAGGLDLCREEETVAVTQPEHKADAGGFGRIEPVPQADQAVEEEDEDEMVVDKSRFVSSEKLRKGRISSEEMRTSSVFKNYQAGEVTTRLYVKNLSKQTTEEDLLYIFGRYVDLESEDVKNMWDLRLMKEGRMKGQAFITYPTERPAQKAVRDVNGYLLHGRPMVVQFARSAKPKIQEGLKTK